MNRLKFCYLILHIYISIGCLGISVNVLVHGGYIKLYEGGIINEGLYFLFIICNVFCPPLLLSSATISFYKKMINYKEYINILLIGVLSLYAVFESTSYLID